MLFYRWHPQLALRYLPVISYINGLKIKDPKIIEVGPGSLGIGPYLNHPFTGVDIDFSGPQWSQMKQVKGRAENLPFPSDSFDIALSVDVIEHLLPKNRQPAIAELFRVARREVIIAVPVGQLSAQQDRELNKEYYQKFNCEFPFLKEHLKYGLPESVEVISLIKSAAKKLGKKVSIRQQGDRNLSLRRWLMQGWMTKNPLINFFFRKVLLLFLPILFLFDKKPPHYRQIFYVRVDNNR